MSIAEQHGGQTVESNLPWACLADNNHKGPNLAGVESQDSQKVWLFQSTPAQMVATLPLARSSPDGRNSHGRATIAVLAIIRLHRVAASCAN